MDSFITIRKESGKTVPIVGTMYLVVQIGTIQQQLISNLPEHQPRNISSVATISAIM